MSRLRSCLAAILAASCVTASAATLKLESGARITIVPASMTPLDLASFGRSSSPLRFSVTEPGGRHWSGDVPSSAGTQGADVTLAQNPVSREIFAVFARPVHGGTQLVFSRWLGQSFSDASPLYAQPSDDRRPVLAFRSSGDALLAFQRGGSDGSILLRHFDLDEAGALETYAFVDAGAPSSFLPASAGRDLQRPARIEGIVPVPDELGVYILVTGSNGGASAILRVQLDGLVDPGGAGAAPVPVTFIKTTNSASSSQSFLPTDSHLEGYVIEPWRMTLTMGTAWYWERADSVDLVTFRGSEIGRLVSFAKPATEALLHVEAYRVARAELGLGLRRPGLDDSLADATRRAR